MKRKLIAVLSMVAATSMVLAACGSSSGDSGSSDTSSTQPAEDSASDEPSEDAAEPSEDAGDSSEDVPDLGHATILTNWFAESSQGGYWAAQAEGLASARGVDLEVKQGGPGIQTIPQVTAGEADFGIGNADEILVAVSNGLPIVAVATGQAQNIQCLAYHEGTGIKSFADLNGHTVSRVPSPYWDYIKWAFKLDNVEEVNIGSLAQLKEDEGLVLQCFIIQEPYEIEQAGMTDIGYLQVGVEGGYKSDQTMLFTTQKLIDENPELVRAVVQASNEGWGKMLDDPTKTKALIQQVNPDGSEGAFDYSLDYFRDHPEVLGTPHGAISPERFAELKEQLMDIGLLTADFDETKAYTTEFAAN